MIDFLFTRPILNVRQAQSALGIPYVAAKRYIDKLETVGVLREITGFARNRVFRADEIFNVLEGIE